jgi:hypothetical protein
VETVWPQEFSVAQASVREAINLLITEGFLVKDAGRSARVVDYREQGVRTFTKCAGYRRARGTIGLLQRIGSSGVEAALERMAIAAERR